MLKHVLILLVWQEKLPKWQLFLVHQTWNYVILREQFPLLIHIMLHPHISNSSLSVPQHFLLLISIPCTGKKKRQKNRFLHETKQSEADAWSWNDFFFFAICSWNLYLYVFIWLSVRQLWFLMTCKCVYEMCLYSFLYIKKLCALITKIISLMSFWILFIIWKCNNL